MLQTAFFMMVVWLVIQHPVPSLLLFLLLFNAGFFRK